MASPSQYFFPPSTSPHHYPLQATSTYPYMGLIYPNPPYQMTPHLGPPSFPPSGFSGLPLPPPPISAPPNYHRHPQRGNFRGRGRGRYVGKSPALFECKACNKEYRTTESYEVHVQAHQKCDKCEFSALPHFLKEHTLTHTLPDMLKLTCPEDIQNWRNERRKNFPTAENIARKKQLDEDKKSRGETAQTPLHRYTRHLDDCERWSGRGRGRGRGRGNFRGRGWKSGSTRNAHKEREESCVETNASKPDDGVVAKEDGGGGDEGMKVLEAILADAAGHKVDDCGDVNTMEEDRKPFIKSVREISNGEVSSSLDGCSESPPSSHVGRWERGRKRKYKERGGGGGFKKRKGEMDAKLEDIQVKKPTLLEKLLGPEVRKEQNIILQCIRYIVDTGFLGRFEVPDQHHPDNNQPDYQDNSQPSAQDHHQDNGQPSAHDHHQDNCTQSVV